jgi:hypothetical protein
VHEQARFARVVRQDELDEDRDRLAFWLSRPAGERIRHVDELRRLAVPRGSRDPSMELHADHRDLLAILNGKGVSYVVVGGIALAHHGAPRFTGDIDLYVRPSPENARRLIEALAEFGFGSTGLVEADFLAEGRVVQLGFAPWRIDFLTSLAGVSWDEVISGADTADLGVPAPVIGRAELIRNKRAVGRPQDLADIARLGG